MPLIALNQSLSEPLTQCTRACRNGLTEKGVLAMNPVREVKTDRFSRTEGKTPASVDGEVHTLLNTTKRSDFSCPYFIGFDSSPSQCGPPHDL